MVRRRGRRLLAAACVALATVSAVAVPAPGPPDAAASMVLAQTCSTVEGTSVSYITVGKPFEDQVWKLLCDGVIKLSELTRTTRFIPRGRGSPPPTSSIPTAPVSRTHLLAWLKRAPGNSMSSLTDPGPPFVHGTNIRREEAAASFVTAFGLTRSPFVLPTGFSDVPACANQAALNAGRCHFASREVRALHVCRYMHGYTAGTVKDPGKFNPLVNLPRGQAAAVIHRRIHGGCVDLKVESVTVDTVDEGETATVTVGLSRAPGAVLGEFSSVFVELFFEEGTATEFVDYDPPVISEPVPRHSHGLHKLGLHQGTAQDDHGGRARRRCDRRGQRDLHCEGLPAGDSV